MSQTEVWLRGPIDGVDPALMPAAHALMQTLEDAHAAASDLTVEELWSSIGDVATAGFHLKHIAASTDRLLTYARGERLTDAQKTALAAEKVPGTPAADAARLLAELRRAIDAAIAQLRGTPVASLQEIRPIGRAALPATVGGLLFHAAEHSQRHAGQLVTTAKILRGKRAQQGLGN